jgi:hypothetical protein
MHSTINRVIDAVNKIHPVAQSNEMVAGWIIRQEEELYDSIVKAHFPDDGGYPAIAREYPEDAEVPLLMQGSYASAYADNVIAQAAYYDEDVNMYNFYAASSNETERRWRTKYFREHIPLSVMNEWRNT